MDPNEALRLLREWSDRIEQRAACPEDVDAAMVFDGLDQWLTRGGAWPHSWEFNSREYRGRLQREEP